ncbi:MAG: hypothetical protein J0L54_01010 [Chitinophagales bacterium]|nr:hypothetical protein [Chitinophagales bacterium]
MKRLLKRTGYFLLALVVLYLLLLIPDPAKRVPVVTGGKPPFAWNRDAQWSQMEERFRNARRMDTAARSEAIRLQESIVQQDLILLESGNPGPADSSWKKWKMISSSLHRWWLRTRPIRNGFSITTTGCVPW